MRTDSAVSPSLATPGRKPPSEPGSARLLRGGLLGLGPLLLLSFGLPLPSRAADAPAWGYSCAEGAPFEWGHLDPSFHLCGDGEAQSPIDLSTSGSVHRPLDVPELDYPPVDLSVANNGHTIQANVPAGELVLRLGDRAYTLLQFHWHTPSEHWVDGDLTPMELHLVHRGTQGELVVLAVRLVAGARNAELAKIFDALPAHEGDQREVLAFNLRALLPVDSTTSFRYFGSLTTPPCSQGVRFLVLRRTAEISAEQIEAFRHLFFGNEEFPVGNARPPQPRNARRVVTDG